MYCRILFISDFSTIQMKKMNGHKKNADKN